MSPLHFPDRNERRRLLMAASENPQSAVLSVTPPERRGPSPDLRLSSSCLDLDDVLIVGMHNIPTPEELEIVKASFPAATSTLDRWMTNWTRMLEANPSAAKEVKQRTGGEGRLYKTEIQWNTNRHKLFAGLIDGEHPGRYGMQRLRNADYYGRHLRGRQRNFLHHYVDDSFSFLSFAAAEPGMAVLWTSVDELMLLYTGIDADGYLTFSHLNHEERTKISKAVKERHEDDGKYWNWKPISTGMRRESVEAKDHIQAADILLDMASRGHDRAFVKAIKSKCGTWTVNLTDVVTREDAMRNLVRDGFDSSDSFTSGLLVQEHLPTTREQRFFVTNGRIVASVCSDRNLNGTNRREGRFFDERVAVIERPEVTGGEFERGQTAHEVNRPLAAAFARAARKIVREMRAEGRLHFVVDMGLTERGVVVIEINSFFRSGPYCLDRRRVTATHRRALTEAQKDRAAENMGLVARRRAAVAQRAEMQRRREMEWTKEVTNAEEESDAPFEFDFSFEPEPVLAMPQVDPSLLPSDHVHGLADRIANNKAVMKTLQALEFEPPEARGNSVESPSMVASRPRMAIRRRVPAMAIQPMDHEG
ncbi:ATP-grasp domain-containing protein [Pararhizobium sp. BT-229]|uniref:ATP-grasp domain-containing protein n=1 Tax=Pararhizobium sp. BT-229 TaxID=2986923 RepID=UPI0021F79226|nr:ATP-grasp domain-containing protein [Pararhizobium sp. BT-229]MCV9964958.1 ATP-grasp domain-containing protein [Pararhizobium sp. BT-229]